MRVINFSAFQFRKNEQIILAVNGGMLSVKRALVLVFRYRFSFGSNGSSSALRLSQKKDASRIKKKPEKRICFPGLLDFSLA